MWRFRDVMVLICVAPGILYLGGLQLNAVVLMLAMLLLSVLIWYSHRTYEKILEITTEEAPVFVANILVKYGWFSEDSLWSRSCNPAVKFRWREALELTIKSLERVQNEGLDSHR